MWSRNIFNALLQKKIHELIPLESSNWYLWIIVNYVPFFVPSVQQLSTTSTQGSTLFVVWEARHRELLFAKMKIGIGKWFLEQLLYFFWSYWRSYICSLMHSTHINTHIATKTKTVGTNECNFVKVLYMVLIGIEIFYCL